MKRKTVIIAVLIILVPVLVLVVLTGTGIVRQRAEKKVTEALSGRVDFRSISFGPGGVRLDSVTHGKLFSAGRVTVNADLRTLLRLKKARRFVLNAEHAVLLDLPVRRVEVNADLDSLQKGRFSFTGVMDEPFAGMEFEGELESSGPVDAAGTFYAGRINSQSAHVAVDSLLLGPGNRFRAQGGLKADSGGSFGPFEGLPAVQGTFRLNEKRVLLRDFRMRLFGGRAAARGRIGYANKKTYDFHVDLKGADMNRIPGRPANIVFKGKYDGSFHFADEAGSWAGLMKKLKETRPARL